jgi:hypothetical protein
MLDFVLLFTASNAVGILEICDLTIMIKSKYSLLFLQGLDKLFNEVLNLQVSV